MSHTLVPVSSLISEAYTKIAADGANGNKFLNDGRTRLLILNPDPAALTLTISIPPSSDASLADDNVIADRVITIDNDEPFFPLKALDPRLYNWKASDGEALHTGYVIFTWGGTVTNVELVAIAYGPSSGA